MSWRGEKTTEHQERWVEEKRKITGHYKTGVKKLQNITRKEWRRWYNYRALLERSVGEGKLKNISGDEGRRGKTTQHSGDEWRRGKTT